MSEKKSSEKAKVKDDRVRNFATVVYPESAPEGWLNTLSEQFVPCFVSPLHDKDVNPTGEPKKPHFHVIVMYEGKKSLEQVKELFDSIGGVGLEKVASIRGYSRYLCHLDNPEKAQYNTDEVLCFCGADYVNTIGLPSDRYKAIGEMLDFCVANEIVDYAELLIYCRLHKYDWFRILCDSGTYVMKEFLKSRLWSKMRQEEGIQNE